MQPKTNFSTFLWKWVLGINWTGVLLKDSVSSSKFWCLLKISVSSPSDASLSHYEFKYNFSENFPGFSMYSSFFIFISLFIDIYFHIRVLFIFFIRILFTCIFITLLSYSIIFLFLFVLTHLGFWGVFAMQVYLQV